MHTQKQQFLESIRAINDAELYKHSRKFPNFTPDTIDENFLLEDIEDKFNLSDQNIKNIIIEISSRNIDYIRDLISLYKENINNYIPNVKRLIIVIFLRVNIELDYELDFTGNYDLLFHQDLFPSNPDNSDLFDFIRKMNYLLYNLFSNIKPNQQEELLDTLKSIWDQNDINWIFNLFPFICQIIKNYNECVFEVFTNSNFFTDSFLEKSYNNPNLFKLVSKIFLINSKVFMNQKVLDYLENKIEHKEYRKPSIEWITTGLKTFSQMKKIDEDVQSVINKLISLFLAIIAKDDLKDDEKNYALESIIEPFILLDTNILLDLNEFNQILNQLSAFSNISSDYYFKFLNFLSSLNYKFEVFDNSSYDSVFENMKKSKFQKDDIKKLWEFTLISEHDIDKILNWRGIELLLSYIEVDESNISGKLQSLIMIQSNLYELHKANLTMFLIKRIYKMQNNKEIFQTYHFMLEMMISNILTVEEMLGLLDLIKLNDFKYPINIIQILNNTIHQSADQFNPKSFIRFDRENQFLCGPSCIINYSHSICFSFRLTQKVDDSLNYEILSILHQEQKKFCSLFLNKKALNVEIQNKNSKSVFVVDNFQIKNEEWNFIEILISNKFDILRLRINNMEKYKKLNRRNSLTEFIKKDKSPRVYQIAIKSSVFDYSNIIVLQISNKEKRQSFYFLMNEYKMDFMKIQSIYSENFIYCLYPTFHEGRKSNSLKCIRNYNIDIINEIVNNDVTFNGRTITNVSNIFDIMKSFDIRKFFLTLFNKINSTSVLNDSQGQQYLLKLLQIFNALNFSKTKTAEMFSIALNSVNPKFISEEEMNELFELWDIIKSKKIKREFLQSIIFNFSFISKLKEDVQIILFKKCLKNDLSDVKSFESLLFNAINYYGKENNVSDYAWTLLSQIFNPNNQNDIESIITTAMKNISNYITNKCITILTDTITKIECNEASNTKKLFSLTVYLSSLNDIETQTLGIKLFCLVERYFNIAENATNIKQTPINSTKYVYQMILSSNVDHNTNQFDILTQDIFNYFIPDTELQTKKDEQIKLQPINSSTNEILESTNEIKISNVTIFPLIVYYSSFCSKEVKNKIIELFNSNTKTNYLSSILDLNLWYFWITNFLSQYSSNNNNNDLSFFINPFVDFFFSELTIQSSAKKITELFLFLEIYSAKLKFDYRQIQLLILIRLLTEFNNSNSAQEILLLYPIIYSCLQIEIKNDSFEIITNKEYTIEENKEEDEKLFKLFTNRYSDNFKFANESTNETDQELRLLFIQSVINLKENALVNLNECNKSNIYLLTSFILFDYVNENKSGNSDQLITNYINTINLSLQTKKNTKEKCLEILLNITNKELILDLEKDLLTKYFQESKTNHKNKLHEINEYILNDLKESEITQIKIEGKNDQEICQLLIRNDKEINQFLQQKFDCYDSTRDEKMGREQLRIQRIQNSYQNYISKNTTDKKYKILNQISIGGTRILMSINNTFTNHIDKKIKWLGKIEIKNSYKYQLSPYSKRSIKVSLNARLLTITEVIDGILFVMKNRIVLYSSLKAIKIPFNSISFIFNRLFSDIENEYQGCEIFTNENRSFYFIFDGEREKFYNNLPDYNQYIALVAAKYQTEQKKAIDLNFDETLKFDFLGNCRKICQSIYQNQSSANLLLQLDLISKWQNYTISNFEYIYYLNMLSNRSYHIGSRYPYFPSLLRRFDSDKINLNDNSNYRDLCIPTIFNFNEQFTELPLINFPISDQSISYLMVRVEPFTTLMFCINDQKFDARIFSTAESMWKKEPILSSPELIPEVFSLPFYLVNENKFDFGKKNDGEIIDDITLPAWSKNHFVFTAVQRLMLENDCSSKNMAKWIDMTFGITQNTYNGQPLFLESKTCLIGCLPDKIIIDRNHPDRFSKTVDDSNATNSASTNNNNNNNGSGLSALNQVVRSPLLNLAKEKGSFNFTNKNKSPHILGIEKEFVFFRTENYNFIVDVNQSPFVTMQVPNESGELLCVSRPLKLAVFGVKSEDHLTVLNLHKKSISLQCKTVAKILCAQSIGGRFILTGGSDYIVRVWDMEHDFIQVSSSCFHKNEVIAVAGCRNTGIIASIDRSMNLVVETLYKRKLIAFVPFDENPENPLIQITKSGLIVFANKGKINCLDSRGREIHKFDFCKENLVLAVSLNLYYDIDSREILAFALKHGEIVLIDLTNFEIIGRNVINGFSGNFLAMCTMKKSRAILLSDGEKTEALLFGKLISSEIANDKNSDEKQNIGEMESFCFN